MADRGVDVRQLMAGVSRAIAEPSVFIDDYGRAERPQMYNLDLVLHSWEIENEYEIRSNRRYSGWLVRGVKRMMRGLTSWFMNPLVNDIRKFNMVVTRTLFDIDKNIEEIKDRLDRLEKSEEELRKPDSQKDGTRPS